MNNLEIQLGEDLESRRKTLKNFIGRVAIVNHPEFGTIKGKIVDCKEDYFELRTPINDFIAFFADTIYDMSYNGTQSVSLVRKVTRLY